MSNTNFKEFIIPCKNKQQCLGDLLFIHGFCVDHTYFVAADELSKYFNIYMIDLPGHGKNTEFITKEDLNIFSFAKYVCDYVEYKKLNNFYLMGHSMGGGIVSLVSNLIPDKIKKLIVVTPYNFASLFGGLKAFYIFYPKNMKQKYRLLKCLYKDYTQYLNDDNWVKMNESQLEFQLANWKNMKYLFKSMQKPTTLMKVRKAQKNINVATLLLVGKYDKVIPAVHTINGFKRYFKSKEDKLEFFTFENSGHLPFEEEQDLFVMKVLNFIKDSAN